MVYHLLFLLELLESVVLLHDSFHLFLLLLDQRMLLHVETPVRQPFDLVRLAFARYREPGALVLVEFRLNDLLFAFQDFEFVY